MSKRKFKAGVTALIAGSLIMAQVGLAANAQGFGSRLGGAWNSFTGWLTGTPSNAVTQPVAGTGLRSGDHVVQWLDKTQLVVDRDGYVVGEVGAAPTQFVSERPSGCPIDINAAYLRNPDGTFSVAETPGLQPGTMYEMHGNRPVPARASLLSPKNILIDEYGRRVQLSDKGQLKAYSDTPISLVPDYGAGTQLVAEKVMDPSYMTRAFGTETMKVAKTQEIIPPNAVARIAGSDMVVAELCPPACPTPVSTCPTPVSTCPTPVTTCPAPVAPCPAPVSTCCPAPAKKCPAPVAVCPVPVAACPETCPQVPRCPGKCPSSDRATIQSYINARMIQANLPPVIFDNLTPEQQRLVLIGQPVPLPVSGVLPSYTLPSDIERQLNVNAILSPQTIAQYGVGFPQVLDNQLAPLPVGYKRIIFGNHVVVLSPANQIVEVIPNVFG